jgi:hypothetical protein
MHNSYFTISKEHWTKVLEKVDKLPERDLLLHTQISS